jgi:hypothetical protein
MHKLLDLSSIINHSKKHKLSGKIIRKSNCSYRDKFIILEFSKGVQFEEENTNLPLACFLFSDGVLAAGALDDFPTT